MCIQGMEKYNVNKVIYTDYNENVRIIKLKNLKEEQPYYTVSQRAKMIDSN